MYATSVSNFNSAITTGLYKGAPGTTNQPLNDYNVVYVWAYNDVGNDLAQLAVSINNKRMFYRTRRDGTTWHDWAELALKSDFTLQYGNLTQSIQPSRCDLASYTVTGSVCTIHINNVSYGSSYSSDTVVFSCPYKPKYITRFLLVDANKTILNCFVGTDGSVAISGYTSGRNLYGSVSFVIG